MSVNVGSALGLPAKYIAALVINVKNLHRADEDMYMVRTGSEMLVQ